LKILNCNEYSESCFIKNWLLVAVTFESAFGVSDVTDNVEKSKS